MKLKCTISDPQLLKATLESIYHLRKVCVFRFTPDTLHIISACLHEPQAWCKVQTDIFDVYDVESNRDNIVAMEINLEPFLKVLRAYQRTNSASLLIHLQRKSADKLGNHIKNSKSAAFLGMFYDQQIALSSTVQHTFRIPVRLLKKDSDERIQEPRAGVPTFLLRMNPEVVRLYRRIQRFQIPQYVTLHIKRDGSLTADMRGPHSSYDMRAKILLPMQPDSFDKVEGDTLDLTVKLSDWAKGGKIVKTGKNIMLMFLENQALILHAFMDDEEKSEMIYYAGAF